MAFGTGIIINIVPPEEAAEFYRGYDFFLTFSSAISCAFT